MKKKVSFIISFIISRCTVRLRTQYPLFIIFVNSHMALIAAIVLLVEGPGIDYCDGQIFALGQVTE